MRLHCLLLPPLQYLQAIWVRNACPLTPRRRPAPRARRPAGAGARPGGRAGRPGARHRAGQAARRPAFGGGGGGGGGVPSQAAGACAHQDAGQVGAGDWGRAACWLRPPAGACAGAWPRAGSAGCRHLPGPAGLQHTSPSRRSSLAGTLCAAARLTGSDKCLAAAWPLPQVPGGSGGRAGCRLAARRQAAQARRRQQRQ
jgi:hypothetical protein